MNREDIIRLAREAHKDLVTVDYPGHVGQLDPWTIRLFERFAPLVAAAQREKDIQICESVARKASDHKAIGAEDCVEAIRSRGEVKP